ncbi:MAG: T9SS type A sorting domain-containing protein, partial [Cyclobacteriaceae bacterium]|nr:T9SS type A sorting domain-containing protein [Cyclobacteriaceae bacterium]
AVLNFSGGNGDAWSGNSTGAGYVKASHPISGLVGKSSLLLRVVFASDVTDNFEGMAFDNVFITVQKSNQTISFAALAAKTLGDAPFVLSATSTSGLIVSFESLNDKVTVAGSTATLVKAGSATIRAKQDGNGNYQSASTVDRSFCINPPKPTITLTGENTNAATLTSNAATGNQWFLNGTAISGATSTTYKPVSTGSYTVVSTIEGCSSQLSNSQAFVITGDIHSPKNDFKVFPNPVGGGELNIALGGFKKGKVNLKIVDMLGKTLQEFTGEGGEVVKTDISQFSVGQYIVHASQYFKKAQASFLVNK